MSAACGAMVRVEPEAPASSALQGCSHEMGRLAWLYLQREVAGVQSPATLEAKSRDLRTFVEWFAARYGDARVDQWLKSDTAKFLKHLGRLKRAPATINRALATLKVFEAWLFEQPGCPLKAHTMPTRGIKPLPIEPAKCKKLSALDVRRLRHAAESLIATRTHKNQRPRRDFAIFLVLLHTGLRVSEMARLERSQYTGAAFVRVRRKGAVVTPEVQLSKECTEVLDDYLTSERVVDDPEQSLGPLFLAGKKAMDRRNVHELLGILAQEANKDLRRTGKSPVAVHAHQLRHTFGAMYRDTTGSDTETAAALGHRGVQHVGRYTRKTDAERAAALEQVVQGFD